MERTKRLSNTLDSFHSSKTYQYANWFAKEYFVWGRKFVKFNCQVDQLRCYERTIIEKESWLHASLRIVSFASVIIPIIGVFVLLAHELDWKKYKLSTDYQTRLKEWDNLFLKDVYGYTEFNDYPMLLEACVKSDLNPANLRFKQIVVKQIFTGANKIYTLESGYRREALKAKEIEIKDVLHLFIYDLPSDFKVKSLVEGLDRDMKGYNTDKLTGNSTFYIIHPSDFRWYFPMNRLSPMFSNASYRFLNPSC